ncbi:MAG: hypothetical protein ACPG47_05200 [Leucothrix sp.]
MPRKKTKPKKPKFAGCPDPAMQFKPGRKQGKARSQSYIKGNTPCLSKKDKVKT